MRNGKRVFSGFDSGNGDSFKITSSMTTNPELCQNTIYSKINELKEDAKLKQIVRNNNEEKFVQFLIKEKFLPDKITFSQNEPAVQLACTRTWCTSSHYLAYAEGAAVVLGVAVVVSVYVGGLKGLDQDRNILNSAVQLAVVMKGKSFGKKVQDYLDNWVNQQVPADLNYSGE